MIVPIPPITPLIVPVGLVSVSVPPLPLPRFTVPAPESETIVCVRLLTLNVLAATGRTMLTVLGRTLSFPVPAAKSFVFETFDAPLGKRRSSPGTGAMPPQFAATDQRPLVVSLLVRVAP